MKIAVIGLGLIGGSLARDFRAAGHTVVAFDRRAASLRAARRARVIAGTLPRSLAGVESCDACVLALPVDAIERTLGSARQRLRLVPLVMDAGSTKRGVMRAARDAGLRANFVGAHPMAGDHVSGWPASRSALFAGKTVYLTTHRELRLPSLRRAKSLWRSVGARVQVCDADAHDALLAGVSHVPQVAAVALAMLLADSGIRRSTLGRGGRDMTRLAASSAGVWTPILLSNRDRVAIGVRRLVRALRQVEDRVTAGDAPALNRLLRRTNRWANARGSASS